ncbi:DNA-binding protein [Sinirhodobacter populi]|uniref:DNA-binding protein n=1 Tax=Paenirhodobacter populi TaxID=2306993 RepID=A0A443K9N1_9RHOB|nr:helix-turn-helix domain-containing protein [Sinirhodobacter populi]RWR29468.1 DNA-binding protein [Sinirhodobacter populi]
MEKTRKSDNPPIDRWRADAMLEPDRKLWGLSQIADVLGVSPDTVRRWANDPSSNLPVSKPMGRWFAVRRDLLAWQRLR